MSIHNTLFKCMVTLSQVRTRTVCIHKSTFTYVYTCVNTIPPYFSFTHTQPRAHTQICTNSQAPYTIANTIHNSKQTVISRFQAASQFCSTLLLVCPSLWGGATAVGFNKSIVFGSCLKGLGFILECCCCCCRGCGRREGYCAGTWGPARFSVIAGPSKDWCLLFDSFNIQCVCVCVSARIADKEQV